MQTHHDSLMAGHPGRAKTIELTSRSYWWPKMRKEIDRYVDNCHTCKRNRTPRHSPFGILRPLPIPHQSWRDISMDFVTGLPWSDGFDSILVIVDRLTKMSHFIPCRSDCSARDLADLFIDKIFRLHGLPDTIISDRGPQFAAEFWLALCEEVRSA